ncbi:hypothetical protein A3H10_02220 [Candidatus Uhrbacteria bacterium RIFCSPLOWO2_12_FULL_46_10]|uniref:Uncharacterized protein n=1 Tax=Candidatus Uhrbacteria bacterium RIFCSPLOWO2_01_FULL_47_25 TaxID=1802402 RepID=A0A1F7URW4_9BACT|nr:MAG: hypothetical protein UX68_C0012G0013 [Parcubacteria group bacterium GW2011_GWA2_46_9]OGL61225.1 MAG: hypothetical protein A2752_00015 [Candidatus Uhrbacteria bacterium RIFCSPHIGHO2_01_FULL_46_23]OGL68345.1 MAG: hypothetical protein A3D60_00515 [Candidatus Uhrbacteria bacterium RIFCSPHIGHO2_02_FULL_47_29]OGL75031.1 MAG: hypothetical protein A3E96_00135 [Candidatus Uhrbacteria bacterium RIFCSPHIGHO2_12_FULL_46_13]OGL81033.1 MAG: hypothetical protein A2936_00320 [Candidatus Uhrbacteria bac
MSKIQKIKIKMIYKGLELYETVISKFLWESVQRHARNRKVPSWVIIDEALTRYGTDDPKAIQKYMKDGGVPREGEE